MCPSCNRITAIYINTPLYRYRLWFFYLAIFLVVLALILIISIRYQYVVDSVKHQDVDDSNKYYTAAVYEYVSKGDYENLTAKEYVEKNLAAYNKAVTTAGLHKADIVIFPEYGILPPPKREAVLNVAPYVPDPKREQWNPCEEPNKYENSYILTNLSCMAKRDNIVLLTNILSKTPCNATLDFNCPNDKFYIYNTNVAFNRSGLLIARHRKTYLFYEDNINVLPEPEFTVFQTDFATIGTIIAFDIVWKESVQMVQKYKPDAVVFSTLWMDYFEPGMNSLQCQQSWAIRNNVTILVANRQRPMHGLLGSGVFFGDTRINNYVCNSDGQSRLLLSKVPKRGVNPAKKFPPPTIIEFNDFAPGKSDNNLTSGVCSKTILGPARNNNDFRCYEFDLTNFTLMKVAENSVEACNNGLCCQARYKAQLGDEHYYLAVINGTYTAALRYTWWLEACLLLRCDPFEGKPCITFPTKSDTVFEELKIEANFTTSYVYPSISISGLQLAPKEDWVYTDNSLYFNTKMHKVLFASLYGRSYDRDPKE